MPRTPALGPQQEQPPPPAAAQQLADWECPHCHNVNFRGRQRCNKCQRPAPQDSKMLQANKTLLANAPVRPPGQSLTHSVRPADSQLRPGPCALSGCIACRESNEDAYK